MKSSFKTFISLFILLTGLTTCRDPYAPPAITTPNRYLVVDGFINTGANTVTSFKLSRTRNLGDSTVIGIPELNAQVAVMGSNGTSYTLTDTAGNGTYSSFPLTLDVIQQYQLFVTTSDGQKYASDLVPCEPTPPIDSVFWRQPFDLAIQVSTHDATGRTAYYRYDYNETWEHDSQLQTVWGVANGMIYAVDSTNQKDRCWTTDTSTTILLANSVSQTRDLIDGYTLLTIPNSDQRVDFVYSILVRQYALTADAYNYWQLIQKTTQNVGTLFDLQPTQLVGNIHCTSNPGQPVIGYLSACNTRQQRIFIRESSLTDWSHNSTSFGCDTVSIPVNPINPFIYNYPDSSFAPWYFVTFGPLVLASRICLDCTQLGGTNIRPPFMPE
jgi:hypothetical protein